MISRIALISAAGITALVVTASAAFGASQPERRGLRDFGLATAATPSAFQAVQRERRGLRDFGLPASIPTPTSPLSSYRDTAERAVPPTTGVVGYVGAIERGRGPGEPTIVSPTSSGSDIEWPQVGVGVAAGILLALGLVLALRYTKVRPLAQ